MQIVGVIDLKAGQAVLARGGLRESYLPVRQAGGRAVNGDPLALDRFYREAVGLSELYVADLDAIGGLAPQHDLVGAVASGGPTWLDAGVHSVETAQAALDTGASRVVIGLETLPDLDALAQLAAALPADRLVFSLDLRDGCPLHPPWSSLARESPESIARHAWEAGITTIVVLDLHQIGGQAGPSVRVIESVRDSVPDADIYAGGGIRSLGDLRDLAAAGVTGALMASALQDGRVTPLDVHSILTR